jgi:hypothetical protein
VSLTSRLYTALFTYFIDGMAVPCHNSYVDLGTIISSVLSFDQHINKIVSKAWQRVSILFNGFLSRNQSTMRQAFTTDICPVLEYNCITWNPTFIHPIDLTENDERNFTKHIRSLSSLPYSERLALDIEFLELCRLRFDLI